MKYSITHTDNIENIYAPLEPAQGSSSSAKASANASAKSPGKASGPTAGPTPGKAKAKTPYVDPFTDTPNKSFAASLKNLDGGDGKEQMQEWMDTINGITEFPYDFGYLTKYPESRSGHKLMNLMFDTENMVTTLKIHAGLRRKPFLQSNSDVGTPSDNTKRDMIEAVEVLNEMGLANWKITFKDTIVETFPNGFSKRLPVDATIRDEDGNIYMTYMFFRYPYVTDWIKKGAKYNAAGVAYGKTKTDIFDRLLLLKCAYCLVDDGYSTMLAGVDPTLFDKLKTGQKIPDVYMYNMEDGTFNFQFLRLLKAIDNAELHRVLLKKYMPANVKFAVEHYG